MNKTVKLPFVRMLRAMFEHGFENTVGKYYSIYRAIVMDNDDPENLGRLKLIIPTVSGNQGYDYWAFPRNVFSGKGHGVQVVPQKGEMVWVEFEGGEPEVPVWSHGHLAREDAPTDDTELTDKDCYWFITPKGHKVKINDTKNTITIKHKDGQYVQFTEDSISLVSDKAISHGSLDKSNYHHVLGEELQNELNKIQNWSKTLTDALAKDVILSSSTPYLLHTNLSAAVALIIEQQALIKPQIDKILSDLATLNK